jgi:hypothetical protein
MLWAASPHHVSLKISHLVPLLAFSTADSVSASRRNRWLSRRTRCWQQQEEVRIEKPTEEPDPIQALCLIQAF